MNRKSRRVAHARGEGSSNRDKALLSLATEAAQMLYRDTPVDLRDTVFLFLDVADHYALYIAADVTSRREGSSFDDAVEKLERDARAAKGKGRRAVIGLWVDGASLAEILIRDLTDSQDEMRAALTKPPPDENIRLVAIADGTVSFGVCDTPR